MECSLTLGCRLQITFARKSRKNLLFAEQALASFAQIQTWVSSAKVAYLPKVVSCNNTSLNQHRTRRKQKDSCGAENHNSRLYILLASSIMLKQPTATLDQSYVANRSGGKPRVAHNPH